MKGFVSTAPVLGLALLLGSTAVAQTPALSASQAAAPAATAHPTLEPEAVAALERMGAYLRTLTTFGGEADVTSEEVLPSGQKISIYRRDRPHRHPAQPASPQPRFRPESGGNISMTARP